MIKLVAMLTMLVDHIGMILFPDVMWLRCIGRLSMPMFAFGIAQGFSRSRQRGTTNKYFWRLLWFTVISQAAFWSAGIDGLNIGVAWMAAVMVLYALEGAGEGRPAALHRACLGGAGAALAAFSIVVGGPGNVYGAATAMLYYYTDVKKKDFPSLVVGVITVTSVYAVMTGAAIQCLAVLAVPAICLLKPTDSRVRLPKWVGYIFYPGHLLVLSAIEAIFT